MVASSAYIVAWASRSVKGASLMYSKKRRGPRHESCGTSSFNVLEDSPLTLQNFLRLFK